MNDRRGQVLVFFALALPLIVLPAAAYAVDASVTASAHSRLVEVTARAAEEAVQQIDVTRLRAGGGISIDVASATAAAAAALASAEPSARVKDLAVLGSEIRLATSETVVLPFSVFGSPRVAVTADVTARIAPGYDTLTAFTSFPRRLAPEDRGGLL
jgi:hypothetical protein